MPRDAQAPLKYEYVADLLRAEIRSRAAHGQPVRLPSYRKLMAEYGVSLSTVRQAVEMLKSEGLITGQLGKGLFGHADPLPQKGAPVHIVIPDEGYARREVNPTNWFQSYDFILGISEGAREVGLIPQLVTVPGDGAGFEISTRDVYIFPMPDLQQELVNAIQTRGGRCVAIDPVRFAPRVKVVVETEEATVDAVRSLLQSGRRRIAFLRSTLSSLHHQGRVRGFRRALAEFGAPYHPELVKECQGSPESGFLAMRELLELKHPPDAVFASTDLRAFGAMQAIRESGLRIPEDIAVVGFDDLPEAAVSSPPLASVHFPRREAGVEAARLAARLLRNDADVPDTVTLHARYIPRESAGISPH